MRIKLIAIVLPLIFLSIPSAISYAQTGSSDRQTVWKRVDNSLAELLDNGWKILDQSTSRAITNPAPGIAGVDTTVFAYTLGKNGKHITCVIYNPRSTEATYSRCFWIN
jgi:hypothetical protein